MYEMLYLRDTLSGRPLDREEIGITSKPQRSL